MHTSILALAASLSVASAVTRGFNYGAVTVTGATKNEGDFTTEFTTAQSLAGTSNAFTSARLYTTIQSGTTNSPISAIPAAIKTKTRLLLGMWASSGQANIDNEIAALQSAISTYGETFTSLVNGISVGSEDLYRISPTGLSNDPTGVGAQPEELASYIRQVKSALASTSLASTPVGHVDTWDVWRNASNSAVISAADFLGMNTFPYYQITENNAISNAPTLFNSAYEITKNAAGGKPVIVTETGWPVSGETAASGVAGLTEARSYYENVGCNTLFGKVDTYWYTLVDANTAANQPKFGVVGTEVSSTPLFDLSCDATAENSTSSSASRGSQTSTADATSSGTGSAASGIVTSTRSLSEGAASATATGTVTGTGSVGGGNGTSTGGSGSGSGSGSGNPTTTGPSPSQTAAFQGSAAKMQGSVFAGVVAAIGAFVVLA